MERVYAKLSEDYHGFSYGKTVKETLDAMSKRSRGWNLVETEVRPVRLTPNLTLEQYTCAFIQKGKMKKSSFLANRGFASFLRPLYVYKIFSKA
jgi:hypothetical protein